MAIIISNWKDNGFGVVSGPGFRAEEEGMKGSGLLHIIN